MVSQTKKKKVIRGGGVKEKKRTRIKTEQRSINLLYKFASPISDFEYYPINSDYSDDNKEPYVWKKMPLLMDTKKYINSLEITKEKIESIGTNTVISKKYNIDILHRAAKDKPTYRKDMTEEQLLTLIKPDINRPKNIQYKYNFPACNAIKENIPSYKVPSTIYEGRVEINGTVHLLDESCFQEYNNTLCKTFILLGIISKYLWEDKTCDYFILIKGGKAVQLLLKDTNVYDSHDIDISIVPKNGIEYNLDSAHNMAQHLARLLKWVMSNIEVKQKPSDAEYSTVVKLYCCESKYAFCDIDYGKPSETLFDYDSLAHFAIYFDSLYISSNLDMTLKEKIYYFVDSFNDKDNSNAAKKKYALFRMEKNKKAIIRLANEMVARKYIEKYADINRVDLMIQYLYGEQN